MPPSDEELMQRVAFGDRDAFASLFDRHSPKLLGLLVRLLRRRDSADDVLQDVFWQVWTRAAQYDPTRSTVLVWLVCITRSRALDFLRRRRRQPASSSELPDPSGEDGALAGIERGETAEVARGALALLSEDQRQVLMLSFFSGQTHESIAAQLALPLGTVKTRIRMAIHRLRDALMAPQREVAS